MNPTQQSMASLVIAGPRENIPTTQVNEFTSNLAGTEGKKKT
jgi:hypothetical protein